MKIDKNLLVVVVLVLLVVVSAVQSVQLIGMKSGISEIGTGRVVKTTSSAKTSSSSDGSGVVPTNLQNLPGMVGGC